MNASRPLPPVEIHTPERKDEFLLNNSVTQESYHGSCRTIRKDFGIDSAKISYTNPDMRVTLPRGRQFRRGAEGHPRETRQRTAIFRRWQPQRTFGAPLSPRAKRCRFQLAGFGLNGARRILRYEVSPPCRMGWH